MHGESAGQAQGLAAHGSHLTAGLGQAQEAPAPERQGFVAGRQGSRFLQGAPPAQVGGDRSGETKGHPAVASAGSLAAVASVDPPEIQPDQAPDGAGGADQQNQNQRQRRHLGPKGQAGKKRPRRHRLGAAKMQHGN
jgi:hypothetical protein